jgi:hypothetical protein
MNASAFTVLLLFNQRGPCPAWGKDVSIIEHTWTSQLMGPSTSNWQWTRLTVVLGISTFTYFLKFTELQEMVGVQQISDSWVTHDP